MRSTSGEEPKTKAEEELTWHLHEDIFLQNGQTNVNPDHLKKTSAQMFAVYKYYGDPTLRVQNQKYTGTNDFMEVKNLKK